MVIFKSEVVSLRTRTDMQMTHSQSNFDDDSVRPVPYLQVVFPKAGKEDVAEVVKIAL